MRIAQKKWKTNLNEANKEKYREDNNKAVKKYQNRTKEKDAEKFRKSNNEAANKSQFANGVQPILLIPYSFPEEYTVIIFIIYCFT